MGASTFFYDRIIVEQKQKKRSPVAIIPQKTLFSWRDIEKTRGLKRLDFVLNNLPDQELMV